MDCSFPPLSYLPPIRSHSYLIPSQFSPAPHLLSRCKALPTWTSPAPTACQPPPLVPAPRAACLFLLSLPYQFSPHFAALGLHPDLCCPLGGSPVMGPFEYLCPCLVLPDFSSESWHCPVWCPCRVVFREKARGQVASTPWQSRSLVLAPRSLAIPAPFRQRINNTLPYSYLPSNIIIQLVYSIVMCFNNRLGK